jgi:hypothetical protein
MCTVRDRWVTVLLFVVWPLLHACGQGQDRQISRRLRATELPGVWVMTRESAIDIQHVSTPPIVLDTTQYTITLRKDGTCHFHAFVRPLATSSSLDPIEDAECTWFLGDVAGKQRLSVQMVSDRGAGTVYNFADDVGSLVSWQPAGDPDARQYVDYRKTADQEERG